MTCHSTLAKATPPQKRICIAPISLVNMQGHRQLAVLLNVVEARVHETAGTQRSGSAVSDQAPAAELHEPGGTQTSGSAASDKALSVEAADELARVAAALGAAAALAQQNGRRIDWLQLELMKRDSQIWQQQQEMKQLSCWLHCQQQLRQGEQASQQLLQQQMTMAHQEAIMQLRSDHALVRLQSADQQRLQRQQVQQQLPQQTVLQSPTPRDLQQKLQRTERDLMVHHHFPALHSKSLQGTQW